MTKFTLRLAAGFLLVVGLLLGSAPAFAYTGASVSATLSSASITPGGKATVTVTITNPSDAAPGGVIGNSTTLPSGVTFANPTNLSTTCPASTSPNFGGTGLQTFNGNAFEVQTVQLAAGASCFYRVDVTAPSVGTFLITPDYASTTTFSPSSQFNGPAPTGVSLLVGTPPVVSAVSPANGPVAGGTTVTITGSNFDPTPSNNTVLFGSASANVTAATATSLTVTSPAESFGSVNVTVQTSGGTSTISSADVFTYAPNQTCPTQTASLAITGALTTTDLSVNCNDVNGGGLFLNSTDAVNFNNIIAYSPSNGYSGAAQTVTTTNATYSFFWNGSGTNFVDTYVVTLLSVGHNASPNVTSSANLNGAAGTDSFTLYDDDNVPLAHTVPFAITIPAMPTVTSISPVSGTTAGGTSVVITGTNFSGATTVNFGATSATSFTFNSATSITAVTPAGVAGIVDVTVTAAGGTSATSAADQYTYVTTPTVTGISPTSGPAIGGTSVVITGTNFTGATAVTFGAASATSFTFNSATQITAVSPAGSGTVDARVTTTNGTSATSSADQFTYFAAPTVTTNPTDVTVNAGSTATFTAAASGTPTPTVQWQFSTDGGTTFNNVAGATSTTLSVPGVLAAQNGTKFQAVFTNGTGSATTTAVTMTVNFAPTVTTSPVNQSISAGTTATFTAAATGNPTPTVQWQVSTIGGGGFINIVGATSTSYTTPATTIADNGSLFRAVFTNTVGFARTTAATLTVNVAPTVTTNPASQTVVAGATASFTAAATGLPTPTVQWQLSTGGAFADITGATSTTLSFTTVAGDTGNQYRAIFSNSAGTATTTAATLTVNFAPTVKTSPISQSISAGTTATFTAAATGNPTPTVQWQVSSIGGGGFTDITGATSTSYTTPATTVADNGSLFRAVFTNTVGFARTVAVTLTVNLNTQAIIFNPPPTQTYAPGGTVGLSATGGASGNAVTFASTSTGVCTTGGVNGATVTFVSAGTCAITASQAGNSIFAAAPDVAKTFAIGQATQTITFTPPATQTYVPNGTVALSATGGASGNAVTFASTSTGVCTTGGPNGATVTFVIAGQCKITASQLGNANYLAAPDVPQSFTINSATQAITATPNPTTIPYLATSTITVSGQSGTGAVSYAVKSGNCTLNGNVATAGAGSGSCVVTATIAADNNYQAASADASITMTPAAQTISFTAPATQTYAPNATVTLSATATSGLVVSYVSNSAAVCSASGNTVSILSAGSCSITASQVGSANYTTAMPVTKSFTIGQATQVISFTPPATQTFAPSGTVALSATGGTSGLPVTFASTSTGVCTTGGTNGATVTFVTAGLCSITASQAGNVNYLAAANVAKSFTISQAAQTIVFTSTPAAVVAAGGLTYTAAATGGASGNAVTFSIDAASGAGVCSIAGSTVSFLSNGTCIVDANQAGTTSYAAAAQKQQTILVQNGVGPTVTAIGSFIADRNNAIVTNLWNMDGTIDRLNDAPGGAGPTTGLADQDQSTSQPRAVLGGHALASQDSHYGTAIPTLDATSASPTGSADAYGLQQMVYGALRQLGETQSVSQLNYSGPFSAQMSTSGDMTGSFHTSLSQIMKWNDQAQQKQAASMGLNTSASASAHQFNPLDVWMQGTYAAINSTQQSKFGLLSSGVDYVFNRNLLLGFYGQVDFMNQTTGLQAAGTGWMVGPYGTMRLSDQMFLEARGGYGRSSNIMTDALDPSLTDQFGSTRWLASAALAGRWHFGDHITFKPNFGFTYFTDSTDAYVNGLSVNVPSVTSQLGQFKFSPEVTKGFSLGDANWFEASLAPELIYNFTSTTADGLGSLDPTATGPQGLRGAIKWGLSMKTPSGLTVSTQGSYDGIGSSGYSAVTASARLNVPLN